MARPLRIEYENAFYHVMNRGKGRQRVFHDTEYFQTFLQCVEEACCRFGIRVHAYCLMENHYHLLLSTPRGNLGRAMRHINGLYTQRYNKLRRTDGALFRGRYKAILVDASSYLLQLSRYIHRNPVELRKPMVPRLADYPWSSYAAYISNAKAPEWLTREVVYGELGSTRPKAAYKVYVEQRVDEETAGFFLKKHPPAILGDKKFTKYAYAEAQSWDREIIRKGNVELIAIQDIVARVAQDFGCSTQSIYKAKRGRGSPNIARWVAMKLCQDHSGQTLAEIGKLFGVGNYCTVSLTISRLKHMTAEDKKLRAQLNSISKDLTP